MTYSSTITLTTDFGHKGPFAAVMRGVILRRNPEATVIDLAHDIPPHWPPEAGFWMSRSYRYFPAGSVHLGIVDPGVGTERDILFVELDGHLFIAPDNGLLEPLCNAGGRVRKLLAAKLPTLGIESPSATFHGRDIFAPIAAELTAGRVTLDAIAADTDTWTPGWLDEPQAGAGGVSGTIVTIDTFGNLISNIDAGLLARYREPTVSIAGRLLPMLTTYGRATPGDYLALINSFGVVEVARAEGNAADSLGLERGAPIVVRDGGNA